MAVTLSLRKVSLTQMMKAMRNEFKISLTPKNANSTLTILSVISIVMKEDIHLSFKTRGLETLLTRLVIVLMRRVTLLILKLAMSSRKKRERRSLVLMSSTSVVNSHLLIISRDITLMVMMLEVTSIEMPMEMK